MKITKPCKVCGKPTDRDEEHPCQGAPEEPWICSPACWETLLPGGFLEILERRVQEIGGFINGAHMHVLHGLGHGKPVKVHLVCEGPDGRVFKIPTSFERLSVEGWAIQQLHEMITPSK